MDYLNNLLVGPLNKLKTAGIIIGSLCVGIIAVSSAALISHSIMSTESSSSTPNPILPLRLLRISSTTPNVTISHIVYDTLSTSDIKTIVNATNSSTELNWRYLWFNATVPINSSIVVDIELPLSLCTNLTIYKYYNNTFQPNKATNINSTSCSFSINITDDDFKGDLSYGARRRSENEGGFKRIYAMWVLNRGPSYSLNMDKMGKLQVRHPINARMDIAPMDGTINRVLLVDANGTIDYRYEWDIKFDVSDPETNDAVSQLQYHKGFGLINEDYVYDANDEDHMYGVLGNNKTKSFLMVHTVAVRKEYNVGEKKEPECGYTGPTRYNGVDSMANVDMPFTIGFESKDDRVPNNVYKIGLLTAYSKSIYVIYQGDTTLKYYKSPGFTFDAKDLDVSALTPVVSRCN